MCLIAWNWQPQTSTPLLVLSNRDEYYDRATLPLHWWDGAGHEPQLLAGQDRQAGGTWLGLSRTGRLAALTNYRTTDPVQVDSPSRGELVTQFLNSNLTAAEFLGQLSARSHLYNPFNLLVCDGQQLLGLQSRNKNIVKFNAGVGAVSNADFNTPWPKLTRLRHDLQKSLEQKKMTVSDLLPLLHLRNVAPDAELPQTGVGVELERLLSATFITSPHYGTRACSVISMHAKHAEFTEQSFGPKGLLGQHQESFALNPQVAAVGALIRTVSPD